MHLLLGLAMGARLSSAGGIAPSNRTLLQFIGAYGPSPAWAQIGRNVL